MGARPVNVKDVHKQTQEQERKISELIEGCKKLADDSSSELKTQDKSIAINRKICYCACLLSIASIVVNFLI